MGRFLIDFSIRHPKVVIMLALALTVLTLLRVGNIRVDTDPENMLGEDEQVRVFHNEVKESFELSDMIILGVINEEDPNGVFNPATLGKVYRITEGLKKVEGVVVRDLMAPSTVDDILQAGPGTVRFKYLMEAPPETNEEAEHIRSRILANPMFNGTLVSEDGRALAIYVPIEHKEIAHRVSGDIQKLIDAEVSGEEQYHITGLPVAEDTFGVEMFQQMGISAPLAGLLIFLLMLFFFKSFILVISPMMVAMLTVAMTMGTLISLGFTVHIMSSMIPIFLMPIAVVDSVHILSVFFDHYQTYRDRAKTLRAVMDELFMPMLYTSVTTMAGFASLALTPIPPVQVFGLFVAFGVGLAWLLTIMLVPAYIMLFIPEKKLENFGASAQDECGRAGGTPLARLVRWSGGLTQGYAKVLIIITVAVIAVSAFGITKIKINDNPVKWFNTEHPIRVADRVLNSHFGGTYGAYLVLGPGSEEGGSANAAEGELKPLALYLETKSKHEGSPAVATAATILLGELNDMAAAGVEARVWGEHEKVFSTLQSRLEELTDKVDQEDYDLLDELDLLSDEVEDFRLGLHLFKSPEVLAYVEKLQAYMGSMELVGKSNSLADMVKKVHMELYEGKPEAYRIPDTPAAVAQSILSFQSSHDPDDVWHLVTPDYRKLNIWVQLKSGDNTDMEEVVSKVDAFVVQNPPPAGLTYAWAGLTYLNVVWQDKMVTGMLESLLGSFFIVLILMSVLFRSLLWGVLSMIPLSVTIAFIYGLIGMVGKDYDMPVAILSSLTLGMSIDFAIHYIQRARELTSEHNSWPRAALEMAEAPARAIARNAVVIAVGFLPLLLSTLVPYRTVGLFLALIMGISGIGTLIILPSLIRIMAGLLFKKTVDKDGVACEIKGEA